jgi:hypothetical protein
VRACPDLLFVAGALRALFTVDQVQSESLVDSI